MTQALHQHAWHLGPQQGSVAAIDFTTSSAEVSLATELGVDDPSGKYLTMVSTVAVYFVFSDGSAAAIDETTVTPGSTENAVLLPANTFLRVVATGSHITTKGSAGGILRAWVSSP